MQTLTIIAIIVVFTESISILKSIIALFYRFKDCISDILLRTVRYIRFSAVGGFY